MFCLDVCFPFVHFLSPGASAGSIQVCNVSCCCVSKNQRSSHKQKYLVSYLSEETAHQHMGWHVFWCRVLSSENTVLSVLILKETPIFCRATRKLFFSALLNCKAAWGLCCSFLWRVVLFSSFLSSLVYHSLLLFSLVSSPQLSLSPAPQQLTWKAAFICRSQLQRCLLLFTSLVCNEFSVELFSYASCHRGPKLI